MYLWMMTSVHRLWVEMSLHPNFDAKAFAKKEVFLCPSLPMLLVLQFDPILPREEPFDLFSDHRKVEHILLDLFKIDLGIHANAIQ